MRLIDANALMHEIEKIKWHLQMLDDTRSSDKVWDGVRMAEKKVESAPTIDAVPVVRCKDCKWYDPPHIDHNDGKRTDVEDGAPFVPSSVGINVGGKCMNTLREYCCNHDREDPDDYERLVKFRERMDFCSDGERKDDESERD